MRLAIGNACARINRVLATDLLAGRHAPKLALAARQMLDEVAEHCRDEERVLEAAGYPDLDRHPAEHAALLRKAEAVLARLEKGAGSMPKLIEFLAYEVIALHMLGADREYAAHLRAAHSRARPELA